MNYVQVNAIWLMITILNIISNRSLEYSLNAKPITFVIGSPSHILYIRINKEKKTRCNIN